MIFLELHKAYNALDRDICLETRKDMAWGIELASSSRRNGTVCGWSKEREATTGSLLRVSGG